MIAALVFATMPNMLPHARAGKLLALVTVGTARSAAAPELPPVLELPGVAQRGDNCHGGVAPTLPSPSQRGRARKHRASRMLEWCAPVPENVSFI